MAMLHQYKFFFASWGITRMQDLVDGILDNNLSGVIYDHFIFYRIPLDTHGRVPTRLSRVGD